MTQTVGELIGRCLVSLGATRVFATPGSGVAALPGLTPVFVDEPEVAIALADADGRINRGPGVALLPDRVLRLGSQPGAEEPSVRIDDPAALPSALAGWTFAAVHSCLELVLDMDLDAPAPEGLDAVTLDESGGEVLTLSPTLADFRTVVLAGPGVVRANCVEGLRTFAAQAGCGVVNTWGAKGVFLWDSPFHLGTAGLQANDFELAGLHDAELVITTGLDPTEVPAGQWAGGQILDVEPWQLAALAWRWETAGREPQRPRLYTELAAALGPYYSSDAMPLSPARAAADLAQVRPAGGLVVADPGPAGLWVARAFPTTEPGSVVVPGVFTRGFATAAALVAGLDGRPALAVVTDPVDELTAELTRLAHEWRNPLTLAVWGAESSMTAAVEHPERLAAALASPGVDVVPVPVDFALTRVLVEVAGEVVAWARPPA